MHQAEEVPEADHTIEIAVPSSRDDEVFNRMILMYLEALNETPMLVTTTAPDRKTVGFNQAFLDLIGATEEQAYTYTGEQIFHPDDMDMAELIEEKNGSYPYRARIMKNQDPNKKKWCEVQGFSVESITGRRWRLIWFKKV